MNSDKEHEAIKDAMQRVTTGRIILTQAESELQRAVAEARRQGWTWENVGDTLGTTRQAAQQRFARPEPQ
jgi:phage gp16-like protein